ncbi:MAG: nucleotide exchange factor GrpE [Chitinophagales bacterium]|nr:nucleotide exchange factor GrpE [Bacteroidota bacterium]MCB9256420.1 nucleotide exchange factor GrpE [Chitinophagales bacterium]
MNTEEKDSLQEEQEVQENTETQEESNKEGNEVELLKQQLAEQKDKYLRLFADFDNYKKRTAKERLDLLNTAGKDIILSIIPVVDDFERAIAVAEKATEVDSVKEGMTLIRNKMFTILEHRGVKAMESIGETFDAEKHEAITEIPAPSEDLKGKVLDQVEKGYWMNDKIIRYAKVVVGK